MKRILTGTQSTGIPHLGNLLGAIIPAINLIEKSKNTAFFFIADLHSLTTQQAPKNIDYYTKATAAAWLACGLDTRKHLLYRQSRIPEVCELTWYLQCLTPYAMLARAHAFKDKANQLGTVTAGLFTYPVLMAADILLYRATHIPVGKDQKQHLEITRDIAHLFNTRYRTFFTLPQPCITPQVAIIPGTDGRKMSKSYHNTINIFATEEELKKTTMSIVTDSKPLAAPKDPSTCVIFRLYAALASEEATESMRARYLAGGYGYQAAKKELFTLIWETFAGPRALFRQYMQDADYLEGVLKTAEQRVREEAQQNLQSVREAIGFTSV